MPEIVVDPLDERDVPDDPFTLYIGFLVSLALHTLLFLILAFSPHSSGSPQLAGGGGAWMLSFGEDLVISGRDPFGDELPPTTILSSPESENPEKAPPVEKPIESIETPNDTEIILPLSPDDNSLENPSGRSTAVPNTSGGTSETERHAVGESIRIPKNFSVGGDSFGAHFPDGGTFDGRTDPNIRQELLKGNGTISSEDAVVQGLRWLAAHQQMDTERSGTWGSWSFHMKDAPGCGGKCRNSGEEYTTTGATALALLAMLGHGNTRTDGDFSTSVRTGLYFLSKKAVHRKGIPGYDLRDGTMYAHTMATLAICEALILEKQKRMEKNPDSSFSENPSEFPEEKPRDDLEILARGAVEWLVWAQHPGTGGWRYEPRTPGDITLTVWALMALKSAKMAGFEVHSPTMIGLERFLNSVASEDGSRFSYLPGREPIRSTTAMGLFGRMFTGAPRDAEFLDKGTALLDAWGYSPTDLYYNYYAAMTLRHYGGPRWQKWNPEMRDYLVATQSHSGHETGSWYFEEADKSHNRQGGRLYTTSMAIMILEVYYRYMPIYQEATIKKKLY